MKSRAGAKAQEWLVKNWSKVARWALIVVVSVVFFRFAYYLIWMLPPSQVAEFKITNPEVNARLINDFRRTWLAVIGGIGAAIGIAVASIRSWAMLRQARAAEEGNITERFTRAIDQIGATHGNSKDPNIEVRLGGIFTLEKIAEQEPEDYHRQVFEVLTAYVRENAKAEKAEADTGKEASVEKGLGGEKGDDKEPRPREDVQTALTVIGRRTPRSDEGYLNLARTHLPWADLQKAKLEGALFIAAKLERAFFVQAKLERAYFRDAKLEGAYFQDAKLEGANFNSASMKGVYFDGTDLTGVKKLRKEQILSAKFDETTIFPDGKAGRSWAEVSKWTDEECEAAGLHVPKAGELV